MAGLSFGDTMVPTHGVAMNPADLILKGVAALLVSPSPVPSLLAPHFLKNLPIFLAPGFGPPLHYVIVKDEPGQRMTTEHTTTPPLADDRTLVTLALVRRSDETAFAELGASTGGLVHGVCRRVLRNSHDVEDAFQATFLVLARDAHRIVKRRSLVSWLHGVAYRTSLRAAESRHRRVRLLQDVTMIEDSTLADIELRHERQKLDEELAGLPEKYRTPLVLHYLEGKSNVEIAKLLGLSVSNIEGRLKRGRKELKLRLTRCGIGLSAALAAVQWSQSLTAATPLETLVGPGDRGGPVVHRR